MELVFKELDKEIAEHIDAFYPKKNCFIEVLPGKVIVPKKFKEIGESIRGLKTYPDDVWLVSYPRTGSTWAQEMIWLLGNKLDFDGAQQMQQLRSPIVELSALFSEDHHEWVSFTTNGSYLFIDKYLSVVSLEAVEEILFIHKDTLGNTVETVRKMARPRFTRSHLPLHLLPKDLESSKAKIIYTARNPKDLCVSFYHYCKLMHGLQGPFKDFLDLFLKERTPIGSYWKHVLPFWKLRDEPNVLFLKYEDMKRDLPAVVKNCAKFLNVDYQITEENMSRICDHLQFDKMQTNPAVNLDPILNRIDANGNGGEGSSTGTEKVKFIRKGQIGDWKNYISAEMSERFDEWIVQNTRGTGLTFDYE